MELRNQMGGMMMTYAIRFRYRWPHRTAEVELYQKSGPITQDDLVRLAKEAADQIEHDGVPKEDDFPLVCCEVVQWEVWQNDLLVGSEDALEAAVEVAARLGQDVEVLRGE